MRSPWGEIPVGDAHVHFFSSRFFAELAKQAAMEPAAVGAALSWEMPAADPAALAAHWAAELNRHGVECAALIASVPGDEASVAAAVARFPHRFFGYFMFDPLAQDAPDRLNHALASGMRGICLFPAMHRYSLHDERVRHVYEAAARHPGTAVFVHCGVLTVGVRKKLGLPSPFDMRYSNPIDLHAIALRFPSVNFVMPHFGAGYFREALMVCDLCPNVYLDTSSTNSWIRYHPEQIDLRAVFRHALDVIGPRRLVFGSDSSFFPRGWHAEIFETQARILYELGAPRESALQIFGGNLREFLRVPTA